MWSPKICNYSEYYSMALPVSATTVHVHSQWSECSGHILLLANASQPGQYIAAGYAIKFKPAKSTYFPESHINAE